MKAHKEYIELLNSGFFFEFYPQLTGDWNKDEEGWMEIYNELTTLRNK